MTALASSIDADRSLKQKHRAMWALGDYPRVAAEVIPDLGARLVAACSVQGGNRVLDVASGAGNAAIPAARAGGRVIANDLTPELLAAGQRRAEQQGVSLEWRDADAEALPFADGTFDVVMSCVGVMFAPNHRAAAGEMVRVCRPGGTIGLVNWTPDGFIGQMLVTMRAYAAPPAPGTQPPTLWGDVDYVRDLFGDGVATLTTRRESVTVDRFQDPDAFRDYFKAHYGPTIAVYRGLADDPDRVAALDRDLSSLARRHDRGRDTTIMEWEYLLYTARKLG
jgi:SAM-dependent methyltransferase